MYECSRFISPDNNQIQRSVRAVTVPRNATFFKKSIERAKRFCNLLTLQETAKHNGIKDVSKWLKTVHRAVYEHGESQVWTTSYERQKTGKQLCLRIPNITPMLVTAFNSTPWIPWRCRRKSAARQSEAFSPLIRYRSTCSSEYPTLSCAGILRLLYRDQMK